VIDLVREIPEAMKPQKIAIADSPQAENVTIDDHREAA